MLALSLAARTIVGVIFFVAGISKLFVPAKTLAESVQRYGLPAGAVSRNVVYVLPVSETCIGASLVVGFLLPVVALISLVLLALFNLLLYRVVRNGKRFRCSCFGTFRVSPVGFGLIIRNTGLMALTVCVTVEYGRSHWLHPIYRSFSGDLLRLANSTQILAYVGLLVLISGSLTLIEYSDILINPESI
jgi:uncharacterized membrane protein YphA (DoxX/SURF4 family)